MSMDSVDQVTRRLVEQVLPETLGAFLLTERWFGGKARPIERVGVDDFAWLPGRPLENALCVAEVAYTQGPAERYLLVIGRRDEPGTQPVVAGPGRDDAAWVVEATADADGAYALMAGFVEAPTITTLRGGRIQFADATARTGEIVSSRPHVRAVGVEQSNSSIRLGPTLVFKLLRRLEYGENPELEIGRFLTTRTAFRAMPALHGSLTYEDAAGRAGTAAIVQSWVDSRGDGWSFALAELGAHLHDGASLEGLGHDLAQLGTTTAELHAALNSDAESPAFAPEPATTADARAWATTLATQAAGALGLVAGATLDGELKRGLERALTAFVSGGLAAAPPIGHADGDGFPKIRIHGDYHLGQTLKTAGGFVLLDFEGEPTRPLADRRRKQAALKDVAGMLRSFDYALATACHGDLHAAAAVEAALDPRGRFLDGYFSAALRHPSPVVPANAEARQAWMRFFELEKALYELAYEVNNRPAWAHIPARGILRLLEG